MVTESMKSPTSMSEIRNWTFCTSPCRADPGTAEKSILTRSWAHLAQPRSSALEPGLNGSRPPRHQIGSSPVAASGRSSDVVRAFDRNVSVAHPGVDLTSRLLMVRREVRCALVRRAPPGSQGGIGDPFEISRWPVVQFEVQVDRPSPAELPVIVSALPPPVITLAELSPTKVSEWSDPIRLPVPPSITLRMTVGCRPCIRHSPGDGIGPVRRRRR